MTGMIHERIGRAVQNNRIRAGLSLNTLALKMKLSVDSLKAVEAGQRRLNGAELQAAAIALDIPVGRFYQDVPNELK